MNTKAEVMFYDLPENIADSFSHSVTLVRTATSYFNSFRGSLNLNQKATIQGLSMFIDDYIFSIYTNDKPLTLILLNKLIDGLKEVLDCFNSSSSKMFMVNYNYVYSAYNVLKDVRLFFSKVYC